nr:TonB family protein [uncultured Undibacterium sp.]
MNSEFSNLTQTLIQALGWSLVHFVWQGCVIALVLAVVLLLTRKARAQLRYAIACVALLLCAALPVWKFVQALERGTSVDMTLQATAQVAMSTQDVHPLMQVSAAVQNNLHWIVFCWALVVALLSVRLCLGLWWLQGYSSGQRGQVNLYWQAQLDELAQQFALPGRVLLRVVKDIESPLTIGWLRPMVLVPASLVTGMEPSYLQALLAHELAHIRRYDYLMNLIQNLIEMILFFHPAVWWISKKIRNERENIADDLAASMLGEPRRLALALQELELLQFTTPQLAQAAHGGNLMSRIKRLIRPEVQSINWKTAVTVFGVTAVCVGMVAHASVPQTKVNLNEASAIAISTKSVDTRIKASVHEAPTNLTSSKVKTKTSEKQNMSLNSSINSASAKIDFETPACRPEYPKIALRNEWAGTTTLQIESAADGKIVKVHVQKTSGHVILDEALSEKLNSGSCKVTPAKSNGVPQRSKLMVQYIWMLDDWPAKKVSSAAEAIAMSEERAQIDFTKKGCRPEYPRASLRNEEQGQTDLEVRMNELGKIEHVSILGSSGFRGLDNAVYEKLNAQTCLGTPLMLDGKAQASTIKVSYLWKLD